MNPGKPTALAYRPMPRKELTEILTEAGLTGRWSGINTEMLDWLYAKMESLDADYTENLKSTHIPVKHEDDNVQDASRFGLGGNSAPQIAPETVVSQSPWTGGADPQPTGPSPTNDAHRSVESNALPVTTGDVIYSSPDNEGGGTEV